MRALTAAACVLLASSLSGCAKSPAITDAGVTTPGPMEVADPFYEDGFLERVPPDWRSRLTGTIYRFCARDEECRSGEFCLGTGRTRFSKTRYACMTESQERVEGIELRRWYLEHENNPVELDAFNKQYPRAATSTAPTR